MSMGKRPRLPEPVEQELAQIKDEYDYPSLGEAVRHVMKEAGYENV